METTTLTASDLKSDVRPIWCAGCGNYGVFRSFLQTIVDLRLPPEKVVVTSGIGCSGRFPAFVKTYGFHSVHGRALPLATGVKLANPELTVFAMAGDGDALSIGGGHLPHAARRNVDLTYIVMDNQIYGLTKGQPSPTSPLGMVGKASPYGTVEPPLNPILMALAYHASFVARAFSGQPRQMTELFKQAVQHRGFAFIQVLSPCVTFFDTFKQLREVAAPLPEEHDVTDRAAAMRLALEEQRLYIGLFYRVERPSLVEGVAAVRQKAGEQPLARLVERFQR